MSEPTHTVDVDGLSYKVNSSPVLDVTPNISVHEEVGESEFEYVILGSNPDDGPEVIAFGFHESEMPASLTTPREEIDR